MTKDQKESFEALSCRLSPENLCCDGLCSRAQTNARYRQIMKEWRKLEQAVGREVSEEEVETWMINEWREKAGMSNI